MSIPTSAISNYTRFHEAGHAAGAVILGIGLKPQGIEIESDYEATTHVQERPTNEWTEEWCISRVAVKLSGGAAEMQLRGQPFDRSTFESDCHYFTDYQEGLRILQTFQTSRGLCDPVLLEQHLCEALAKAFKLICDNWGKIESIANALSTSPHLDAFHIKAIVDAQASEPETSH